MTTQTAQVLAKLAKKNADWRASHNLPPQPIDKDLKEHELKYWEGEK